jgi:hypothetical protein
MRSNGRAFKSAVVSAAMKHLFALFLTILTGVTSVWASLGDSDDKIENLYGNVVARHLLDDGTVSVLYHRDRDRYLFFVVFDKRKSVLERYSRIDKSELSPKEISRFLKANAVKGAGWTSRDKSKEEPRFERADHKAEATYGKVDGSPSLTVKAER